MERAAVVVVVASLDLAWIGVVIGAEVRCDMRLGVVMVAPWKAAAALREARGEAEPACAVVLRPGFKLLLPSILWLWLLLAAVLPVRLVVDDCAAPAAPAAPPPPPPEALAVV